MEEFPRGWEAISRALPGLLARGLAVEGRSLPDGWEAIARECTFLLQVLLESNLQVDQEQPPPSARDRVQALSREAAAQGLGLPECLEIVLGSRRVLEQEVLGSQGREEGARLVAAACDQAVLLLVREWNRQEGQVAPSPSRPVGGSSNNLDSLSITEALNFPVFVLTEALEAAWCNQAARDFFTPLESGGGASPGQPASCGKVVPEVAVAVAAMVQAGSQEAFLEREVRTRGGPRFMGIWIRRLSPGMTPVGSYLVAMVDLTRRREMEGHLRRSRQALEEKVRVRAEELEQTNRALQQQMQERNAAEAVLRESEERYRLLVTLSPDGIVVHQNGRVVFYNEAAATILGASGEEGARLLGQPVVDFVHPDCRAEVVDRIRRMSEGQVAVPPMEERFLGIHGEVVDVEVKASAMTWEGRPAVMVVFRDIRERQRARKDLEERAEVAEVLLEGRERLGKTSPESLPDEIARVFGKALRIYRLYWCVPDGLQGPFRIAGRFCWFDSDRPSVREVSILPGEILGAMEQALRSRKTICLQWQEKPSAGSSSFAGEARSILLTPVAYSEKVFGVLVACCREENGFPENRRLLAQTAAEYIGAALENIQLTMRLREAEERFRSIFTNALEGIYAAGSDGRLLAANPALARILGYRDPGEMVAAIGNFRETVHADPGQQRALVRSLQDRGEVAGFPYLARRADGRTVWVAETAWAIRDDQGRVLRWEGLVEDIHERRVMERHLQRGQKMEALGRLAGGVAHDFNNLLAAILGFAGILLDDQALDPKSRELVDEIRMAGERGADLTRRLLVFSRGQVAETTELDLVGAVRGMEVFLRRLVGEDIDYQCLLPEEPIWVRLQGGTLDQLLMNLAVNARDAMPQGGVLRVRVSRRAVLPDEKFRDLPVSPGDYGEVEVTDTGVGMDPEVQARAFEPFFSTKEDGKGTGLGLSVVYGIVRQSGGAIFLESEVGRGTRFRILLPAAPLPGGSKAAGVGVATSVPVSERDILVVEDEAAVRGLLKTLLERAGYRVQVAIDGRDALEIVQRQGRPPDLLVTDLVMPRMDGEALVRHLRAQWPELPILCISGYARDTGLLDRVAPPIRLIQKPFHVAEVLGEMTRMLGGTDDGSR